MNKVKRTGNNNNNILNHDEIKRKKLTIQDCGDTNWFFTHFEDLSNDVLYEIFEYLDFFQIYQAFFDLNRRFEKLLIVFNLPININISSISKSVFQCYYTNIILPHQHQISSLRITNFLSFDLDISPHHILSTFIQLKTLILENIQSKYLDNILKDITSLFNLSTLVIIPIDDVENANHHLLQILHLPTLKYCKLSFVSNQKKLNLLPFATNQYSSIEQLVIKHEIHLDNLYRLLSYVPQLRRLSLYNLYENRLSQFDHSIVLKYLTHLFLDITDLDFNRFELLIKHSFCSLQVLHLLDKSNAQYLNAKRWEQLISSYISSLRIFDIHCSYRYVRNTTAQLEHEHRLNQFTTSFWSQRQWFFTYEDYFKYGYHYITFYSTNPYRKKIYKFDKKSNNHLCNQQTNLSSIRDIYISNEEAIIDCLYRFPNATNLFLNNISFKKNNSFIDTLQHIISLQNLTKLIIECEYYSFEKFIELISLTPNVDTLNIQSIELDRKDFLNIQTTETFQFVSNNNMIRNVTIKQINEIEKIELLFKLCPQIQQFTIEEQWTHVKELIQLLLSSSSKNNLNLFSLCFSNENKRLSNKLDTLIQGGKLLDNYFIKSDYPKIYLWW